MLKFIWRVIFGKEDTLPSAIHRSTDVKSAVNDRNRRRSTVSVGSSTTPPEDSMSGFMTGYALNLPVGGPGAILGDIARDGCIGNCPDSTPSCESHDSYSSCDSGSSFDSGSSDGGSDGGGSCGGSD